MLRKSILLILLWLAGACCAGDGDFAYRVKCEKGNGIVSHGTAGAVSAHTLVTAAHVIAGADEIFIDHEIGWLRCKVVKFDAHTDLAVIECKSVTLKFVPVETAKQMPGESLTIWASVAGAKIKAIAASIQGVFSEHQWKCVAQGFDHGGSGSPVVHDNKLVGVAVALDSEKTKQPIVVMADCIQHVLAPETFVGEKLPPPKAADTRAEIVIPPPEIPFEILRNSEPKICQSCRAPHQRSRHWDSDVDGHGQGGWVYE